MKKLLFILALGGLASAQVVVPDPDPGRPLMFPDALKQYLALTNAQVLAIQTKNLEYTRLVAEKGVRMIQVRREIAVETRKDVIDPLALGVRYQELELIRRDIEAAEDKLVADHRKALQPEQIAKLDALEKAMQMVPLYAQAAGVHLVEPALQRVIPAIGRILPLLALGSEAPGEEPAAP